MKKLEEKKVDDYNETSKDIRDLIKKVNEIVEALNLLTGSTDE